MTSFETGGPRDRQKTGWTILIGALILTGLVIRVCKSWAIQFTPDSDAAIVGLMARHMVEGRDFPVFFYGQPYMGSLEPAISALLCRIFGISPFVISLGTSLLGVLVLPLVYMLGREAGGRNAGLLALLYCLVGSESYFRYSVVARGGYMTMMVLGLLTLWLAVRIAKKVYQGHAVSPWPYLALGIAAGLGWWSNQLVMPFLLASAAVLLLSIRRDFFRVGLWIAALGFLAGSLPWWGWNITHHWESISYFGGSSKDWPFISGLRNVCVAFQGIADTPHQTWWGILRMLAAFTLISAFIILLIRERWKGLNMEKFFSRMAAVFLAVFMVVLYASSDYGNPPESRYLLPLIPAVAIMLGVGTGWTLRSRWFPAGVIMFTLAIPSQIYVLHQMFAQTASERTTWNAIRHDAPRLAAINGGACIGGWEWVWMTLASDEIMTVAALPKHRYAPDAINAELNEKLSVVANYYELDSFLACTRGTSQVMNIGGIPVTYDITPPPLDWIYMDPALIADIRDEQDADYHKVLTDGIIDTCWNSLVPGTKSNSLTITFTKPVNLCGVRMFTPDGREIRRLRIEGQAGSGDWSTLLPDVEPTIYFWSGPYPQIDGVQHYQEFRVVPPTGGVSRIRISATALERPYLVHLGEILFMTQAAPPAETYPLFAACETAIRAQKLKKFYGPRWISEKVAMNMRGEVETPAPSLLYRTNQDSVPDYDTDTPHPVVLNEKTGFIVEARDLPRNQEILNKLGLRWTETPLGLYVLLAVAQPDADSESLKLPTLCWTETGCFARDPERLVKQRAQLLYEQSTVKAQETRLELLQKVVGLYHNHQQARAALVAALKATGKLEEADRQATVLKDQTTPVTTGLVHFANNVELLGVTLSAQNVSAGSSFEITYFWKCPPAINSKKLGVFVHLQKKSDIFQDDHFFLENVEPEVLQYQPFPEIFTEHRRIAIPASMAPGEYTLRIGLYSGDNRIRMKTRLHSDNFATEFPVTLSVKASL